MSKLKFSRPARGEHSGKGFFISTFRFDLPLAQNLERISMSEGISLSQVINQILQSYVNSVEVPKGLKLAKTAAPTTWGNGKLLSKEEKALGSKAVPPKMDKKPKKVKAKKSVDEMTDEEVLDYDFEEEAVEAPEAPLDEGEPTGPDDLEAKPAGAAAAFSALKKKHIEIPDED